MKIHVSIFSELIHLTISFLKGNFFISHFIENLCFVRRKCKNMLYEFTLNEDYTMIKHWYSYFPRRFS